MTCLRIALALLLSTLTLQLAAGPAEPGPSDIERLESSVDALSDALIRIGDEQGQQGTARDARHTADALRRDAHRAQQAGHHDRAMALMQEALVTVKLKIAELKQGASGSGNRSNGSDEAESDYLAEKRRGEIAHLNSSLDALTEALVRIGEEKARAEFAGEIAAQARQHQLASQALTKRDALVEARDELDQALVIVKTAIATLRNRDTLVRSLDFASKEEEYRYEQDRQETYTMLIDLLMEKLSPDDSARDQMARFREEADEIRRQAEAKAAQGDFDKAVELQDQSNRSLLKAIRRGGIYVPG